MLRGFPLLAVIDGVQGAGLSKLSVQGRSLKSEEGSEEPSSVTPEVVFNLPVSSSGKRKIICGQSSQELDSEGFLVFSSFKFLVLLSLKPQSVQMYKVSVSWVLIN